MVLRRIASLLRPPPIRTAGELAAFVDGEATRVAQAQLFAYLKARMGTRWPEHFADPAFARSLADAQRAGREVCLADLAVFTVATLPGLAAEKRRQAAEAILAASIGKPEAGAGDRARRRVVAHDWTARAEQAFEPGLAGLIETVPVVASFREEDREAFSNALALRWTEVRRRFRRRADPGALARALAD